MTFTAKVAAMIEKPRLALRDLSDVEPQEVSWLWSGRLVRGKYQVIMGMPDTGKTSLALDFTLGDGAGKFALTWHEDAPGITPDELLRSTSPDEKTAIDEAAEFLSDYLASGPANAGDVVKAARSNAITDPTLKRAKKRLNVQTTKTGFNNSSWAWRLPIPHATPKGINVPSDPLRENIKKNASQEKPVASFGEKEVTEI